MREQEQKVEVEQEMEQPEVQGSGTPFYQPTIMPSEKADLYDKINPQDIVDYLKFRLMGMEWNRQEMKWESMMVYDRKEKKMVPQKKGLTELGASEITTLMLPVSSKNVIISKLNDSEIRQRTRHIVKTAMLMCMKNWKEYGITGGDQVRLVKEIVVSNTFITLKQPENAGAREFLGKSSSENKQIMEDNHGSKGVFGLFRK